MRIERIAIRGFGRFEGLDSGAEPLGRLTVVTGPNESGKSTFFSFLTSLLYGFQPAAYDRHPYAPWNGAPIEGEARLRLDDGTRAVLTRKLLASPWGRLKVEGAETDLRNRPLPFLDHIPRSVFTQVYALTLAELGRLEGATWSTIQERMIASLIADDVRPAAAVIEELTGEAGSLWRPNRRGHQTARALNEEIHALQHRRREAGERDQEIRVLDQRLGEAGERLQQLRARRTTLTASTERLAQLLPDSRRLERLQTLAQTAEQSTTELPLDPVRELDRMRRDLANAERRAEALRSRSVELERARADAERRLDTIGVDAGTLRALQRRSVEAALARSRCASLVQDLEREPPPPPSHAAAPDPARHEHRAPFVGAGSLTALGIALCLGWARTGGWLWGVTGLVCLLGGVIALILVGRRAERVQTAEVRRVAQEAARAERERRRNEIEGQLEEERSLVARTETELTAFFGERDLRADDLAEASELLERLLVDLADARLQARAAEESVERLAPDVDASGVAAQSAEAELRDLEDRLAELGDGNVERGIRAVERFRTQSAESLRLTEEIQARHGSAEQLATELERFASEFASLDEATLSHSRAQLQELSEEIEDVRSEITALEKDIAHLRAGASVSEIDAEIESLKERRHAQERERDRRIVLARVIEEADRRFRERHQPDVIRRGAEYVAHITSGRYRALKAGEGGDDAMLYAMQEEGPPRDVAGPLSTGTKEQIYLALRLAVIDHLDQERERLPLFLDESFVNWDAERRNQGLRLLKSLAQHRQIFVFTCHQEVSDRLQTLGAHVLRLGDGEQVELW